LVPGCVGNPRNPYKTCRFWIFLVHKWVPECIKIVESLIKHSVS